jgi:hypothetical protein
MGSGIDLYLGTSDSFFVSRISINDDKRPELTRQNVVF